MTKPELGTKRICSNCTSKFYDLHTRPITCPTCKTVFELPPAPTQAKPRQSSEVSTVRTRKPAIGQGPTTINSNEKNDVPAKDKNEDDDYIDEDFEKE